VTAFARIFAPRGIRATAGGNPCRRRANDDDARGKDGQPVRRARLIGRRVLVVGAGRKRSLALFRISNEAADITGKTFLVDGRLTALS